MVQVLEGFPGSSPGQAFAFGSRLRSSFGGAGRMTGCMADGINTFNENPLHKALKEWCGGPEAEFEVPLEGYIIDAIVDGVRIEVQTRTFGKMRR